MRYRYDAIIERFIIDDRWKTLNPSCPDPLLRFTPLRVHMSVPFSLREKGGDEGGDKGAVSHELRDHQ